MARETELKIVIRAKNEAEKAFKSVGKNLDTIKGKLQKHQKAFKAMTIAGIAAMGALTLAVGTAVKEAAIAEGAWNKFNTVFGEHTDDMEAFIKDIRMRMPTATHEIVRMAANLQDLLVPLGLSRELATEMTQGFLEVANQIAAFNDVEPTEVLLAISSALAGSSEPLRRFGVNALETNLETMAMKEGLLEAGEGFKDLDVNVKNQIRAQALLATIIDNSADAIAGFEANNDSFIRRSQALQATIKETKVVLGNIFLPIIDNILKKLLPMVEKIGEWVKANPELTKVIIIATAAIVTLVAIIGGLGLVLPGIITMFTMLSAVSLPITAIILAIIVVIGLFIAIGWTLYKDWDTIARGYKIIFEEWKANVIEVWNSIRDYFKEVWDSIKGVFRDAWEGIKSIVGNAITWLMDKIRPFLEAFEKVKAGVTWIGERAGGLRERAMGLLGFQEGGIVPGPIGAPVPAIVHGGETIIPAGKSVGIVINITGNTFMSDEEAAEEIGDRIIDRLRLQQKL